MAVRRYAPITAVNTSLSIVPFLAILETASKKNNYLRYPFRCNKFSSLLGPFNPRGAKDGKRYDGENIASTPGRPQTGAAAP
jgi:hypothetical protein